MVPQGAALSLRDARRVRLAPADLRFPNAFDCVPCCHCCHRTGANAATWGQLVNHTNALGVVPSDLVAKGVFFSCAPPLARLAAAAVGDALPLAPLLRALACGVARAAHACVHHSPHIADLSARACLPQVERGESRASRVT